MTFKKIDEVNNNFHDRSCVILVDFNQKELSAINAVCRFVGIKDLIVLTGKEANTKVRDILDNNISEGEADENIEKAIVFNNIQNNKVMGFFDGLKKLKIRRPLCAMVTEVSIEWTLATLIDNLKQERIAMSKGQSIDHSK